jgi:hypothetical protein
MADLDSRVGDRSGSSSWIGNSAAGSPDEGDEVSASVIGELCQRGEAIIALFIHNFITGWDSKADGPKTRTHAR